MQTSKKMMLCQKVMSDLGHGLPFDIDLRIDPAHRVFIEKVRQVLHERRQIGMLAHISRSYHGRNAIRGKEVFVVL
ncbi:transcriptional regulators [Zymobacter palmae]|uniref:Transcriptional regulators n=1 Tax=Zymobacter palmae TaxID=33074 RepID=A0A348HGZ1_9GAMM|nr:transcriptional regulators [Zymobacter palmae]